MDDDIWAGLVDQFADGAYTSAKGLVRTYVMQGVEPVRWYGVWLFTDWLEFSGAEVDLGDPKQVAAMAAVELEAGRRDPYRQLSRPFHLVGRKGGSVHAGDPVDLGG